MKVHKNFLTEEQIGILRNYFNQHNDAGVWDTTFWIKNRRLISEICGKDANEIVQQTRSTLREGEFREYILDIMSPLIANAKSVITIVSRSHYPSAIHVDAPNSSVTGRTILVPLTFDERIQTVVWDKITTNEEFGEFSKNFLKNVKSLTKVNDISSELLLNSCWIDSPHIADYIEFDGVAPWEHGSVFEFNRQTLHASNNYLDFVPYKDYVLLHTYETLE